MSVPDDLHIPPTAGGQTYRASYRAQPEGNDGLTRKLLLAAVGLGGILLTGMGGWALLGHRSAPVPVIEADGRPLRVKPDNAGGMQVAGADEQVMGGQSGGVQMMAPRAEAPAPQALRAQMQAPGSPSPAVATAPALAAPAPVAPVLVAPALPAPVQAAPAAPMPAPAASAAAQPGVSPLPDTAAAARNAAPAASAGHPAAPATGITQVQLAAVDSENAAHAEWQRLAKRMPDVLTGRRPVLQRVERDGKAVWRIRTGGFTDVADATTFCTRVRAKGVSCTIAAF